LLPKGKKLFDLYFFELPGYFKIIDFNAHILYVGLNFFTWFDILMKPI